MSQVNALAETGQINNNTPDWGNVEPNSTAKNRIGFHEEQEALLCGKHALNNVLQEEKFVWVDVNEVLIGIDDVMDSD